MSACPGETILGRDRVAGGLLRSRCRVVVTRSLETGTSVCSSKGANLRRPAPMRSVVGGEPDTPRGRGGSTGTAAGQHEPCRSACSSPPPRGRGGSSSDEAGADPVTRRLAPEDVEAVARRVVELLAEHAVTPQVGMVDTAAVARLVGMSEQWARDHAAELGGVRVGDGPRGELRFDLAVVRDRIAMRRLSASAAAQPAARPGPPRGPRTVRLLPLPEGARR